MDSDSRILVPAIKLFGVVLVGLVAAAFGTALFAKVLDFSLKLLGVI